MKYLAVTTIHHGRPQKDETGRKFSVTEVINPGYSLPNDLTQEEVYELVKSGAACAEKDFDRVNRIRARRAALYAPELVDKENEGEDYDPKAAAELLNKGSKASDTKEEDEVVDDKKEEEDDKKKENIGIEPKPSMSKAALLEIAKDRGVVVDEASSRDEVYTAIKEAEAKA